MHLNGSSSNTWLDYLSNPGFKNSCIKDVTSLNNWKTCLFFRHVFMKAVPALDPRDSCAKVGFIGLVLVFLSDLMTAENHYPSFHFKLRKEFQKSNYQLPSESQKQMTTNTFPKLGISWTSGFHWELQWPLLLSFLLSIFFASSHTVEVWMENVLIPSYICN